MQIGSTLWDKLTRKSLLRLFWTSIIDKYQPKRLRICSMRGNTILNSKRSLPRRKRKLPC